MDQNVAQWLAEIQSLQRQVSQLHQEREQAYASVENWRNLYELEAKQRRRDSEISTREIARLQQALTALEPPVISETAEKGANTVSGSSNAENIRSAEQLKGQLVAAKQYCEQLKQLLENEKAEHEKTRESLTAALGDAVDLLAKERLAAGKVDIQ
ncbi:MAG: hypothetical protein AAFQ40_11665 [Cyanobacteria bacterium J06623_5]